MSLRTGKQALAGAMCLGLLLLGAPALADDAKKTKISAEGAVDGTPLVLQFKYSGEPKDGAVVTVYVSPDPTPLAVIHFDVSSVVVTNNAFQVTGIVTSAVSPIPDQVGRPIVVNAGYTTSSAGTVFDLLVSTTAGNHTLVASVATGSLTKKK